MKRFFRSCCYDENFFRILILIRLKADSEIAGLAQDDLFRMIPA